MEFKPGAVLAQRLFLATVTALSYPISAAAATATDVPVYPAAETQPMSPNVHSVVSRCGHTFTMEKSITVDADSHAVAKWYQRQLPGSRAIDMSRALSDEGSAAIRRPPSRSSPPMARRQSSSAACTSTGPSLRRRKRSWMDKTDIGIEGISPPLAPGYIALTAQFAAGGASAQKAKQQMEAACRG